MTYLVGLDLGTSAVKALLLDPEKKGGWPSVSVEIPLSTPRPGWSEQDPEDWWSAACSVIRSLLHKAGVDPGEITALATSGQMHGATLLDSSGTVLRPAILWNDQRSAPQCATITERVGLENLLHWVGNPALAGFTIPKLLWVRDNEPQVFAHVASLLLPKDYINYRLTGRQVTEPSDASGTLLFDVGRRRWSQPLATALELDLSMMPEVIESINVVGGVSAEAAAATGLKAGTPVVAGGADNACAAVGMGVVQPGQVLASIGTSGTLVAPMDTARVDPAGRLHTFCHAVPDTWYAMGVVLSAGGSLRWLRDTLFDDLAEATAETGDDPYDVMLAGAESIPPGSEGLVFLPYLTGERTPHGDPDARGVFFGLSLRHTRDHMTRSVVEGVTFALGDSAKLMRDLDMQLDSVRATGGGARSPLWREILAATLQASALTAASDEGPALGAAILAGVGVGVWPTVRDATDTLVSITAKTEPERALQSTYARCQRLYDGLYPALQASFKQLAATH